ncbi:9480_t:CDS:2, partial [Racocetra persica]
ESSSNESNWENETLESELNNIYKVMLDATSKQNTYQKTLKHGYYNGDSDEKKDFEYSLSELEKTIKNSTQDIWLQYVAQYLRLVESGFTKMEASNIISTLLNRGPWIAPEYFSNFMLEMKYFLVLELKPEKL